MRISSLVRRLAPPLAALILVTSAHAFAGEPPPDPDTTAIGHIQHVRIGRADCDTCPPRVCPGEPVLVTISGELPSPCIQFRGFRELPVGAPFTALLADFVADSCGTACPAVMVPFSAALSLPPSFNTSGSFVLAHQVRSCPDTFAVASSESRQYTYVIEPNCVVVPPLDSLVRSFVSFAVTPARRCPGDSLSLMMKKNGCPPCVHLSSLTAMGDAGFHAVVDWQPLCAEFACNAESLSVPLGRFAAGLHLLRGSVTVRVLGTGNPDSSITYTQRVGFEVPAGCNGTPCVDPRLPPGDAREPYCAATIPRGGTGEVIVPIRTGVDVWGAQGWLSEHFPLRVLDIQYAGAAPGTFVTWHRDGQRVRFVAFTTGNQPMVPVGRHALLRVRLGVDSAATPEQRTAALNGVVEQAAGRNGEGLPLCLITTLDLPPNLVVCIGTPADACDANGDGRADVRDLVRMVPCLWSDSAGVDSARVCIDCNADGGFDLGDLMCCARHILRAPQLPLDSVLASPDVRVSFGTLRLEGDGWRVPVRVTGAGSLAGTLLRMRYPAERWRADIPVTVDAATGTNAGGMTLVDTEQPGVVHLAWLKTGEGEASELLFEIAMRPLGEPRAGDALAVEGADLVRPDGTTITPAEALPAVSLTSPGPPPGDLPGSVALSPARPNPFSHATRFSVSLPRESVVELTVHDVAGRVVATLARGRFAAGVREFEWDGAGAKEGVYFARLSVDGRVLSQRVALLRGR